MKKIISVMIATVILTVSSFCQSFMAPMCSCTPPSNSTCNSDCLFSSCCICWNPNTQTGACGCYWGVATCRNENNTNQALVSSSNFGELNPNAKIKFSFEKFNLLFDFFRARGINSSMLENSFQNIKSRYVLTGQKIPIDNSDFSRILSEYSKLIDSLSLKQKEELNVYIKSLS